MKGWNEKGFKCFGPEHVEGCKVNTRWSEMKQCVIQWVMCCHRTEPGQMKHLVDTTERSVEPSCE